MIIKTIILSAVFLLGLTLLEAQENPDTIIVLEPIPVFAQKQIQDKGFIEKRIDTSLIRESLDASLATLLSTHSPVFIKTYGQGGLATVSFRGSAASHTKVSWNGININNPMLGQVDMSLIPVYFIDEVQLYHGGSSLQHGSGALGGSVLVNSKPSWDTALSLKLIPSIASYNTWQTFVQAKGGKGKVTLDFRAYHEQSENDFLYYNNATGLWNYEKQQQADYRKHGTLLNSWIRLNKRNILSLHLWGTLSDRNLPPIMSYQGSGREEQQQNTEFFATGKWKNYGLRYISEFSTGYTKTRLDYYLANKTPLGLFVNYDSRSHIQSFYNKYLLEFRLSSKTLLITHINYHHHQAMIYDNKTLSGYDATRNETGASLNVHHAFSKRMTAFGLIRFDYVDKKTTPVMPSAGMEYQIFRKTPLTVTVNFTRNYHQPTLNDLYWQPGGNPDLRPEQGYSGDIAMEYTFSNDSNLFLNTGIGRYTSYISDWIVWRPGEFRYWQPENIQKVHARGIEYNLTAKGNFRSLGWVLFGNLAYTKTTNETENIPGDHSTGKQLMYIPLIKGNVFTEWSFLQYFFSYSIAYTGERFTTSSSEQTRHTLPAYTLQDISFGRKLKFNSCRIEIQFKINNLYNVDYQAILWRAMPGRNYKVLFRVQI